MTDVIMDPRLAARHATTVWGLHFGSFQYYASRIFPEKYATPQGALLVDSEAISDLLIRERGLTSLKLHGRDLRGGAMSLWALTPWERNVTLQVTKGMGAMELLLEADRANLEAMAYAVYAQFDFVADSMLSLMDSLKSSPIRVMQFRSEGWTGIPDFREPCGAIGRRSSVGPEELPIP